LEFEEGCYGVWQHPGNTQKALAQASASPDENGLFTTPQLLGALYGELHLQKVRVQRAMAERIELENQITRSQVVDKAMLMRGLSQIADAMVSRIRASSLSRDEQTDLLTELSSVPIVLEDVARRQSRLPRRDDKRAVDVDGDED